MAIGTTPLFSKISGSVGPVDYRTRRNGKIEIGKKRIPANPQSTEQQNTRNAYGRLHELWQNAAWIDKTQYENIAAAYDISPWNAFLMCHLSTMRLNPVAYWPFVEGVDNTLHDFTSNNNHGTIYGASWSQYGKYSIPRLFFDGIDDYVDYNTLQGRTSTTQLAIYAIINITGYNPVTSSPEYGLGYILSANSSYLSTNVGDNLSIKVVADLTETVSAKATELNKYYYLTGNYNGVSQNIKLSNVIKQETSNTGPVLFEDSGRIGNFNGYGNVRHFNGYINSVALFNTPPTTDQQTRLYNFYKKLYDV